MVVHVAAPLVRVVPVVFVRVRQRRGAALVGLDRRLHDRALSERRRRKCVHARGRVRVVQRSLGAGVAGLVARRPGIVERIADEDDVLIAVRGRLHVGVVLARETDAAVVVRPGLLHRASGRLAVRLDVAGSASRHLPGPDPGKQCRLVTGAHQLHWVDEAATRLARHDRDARDTLEINDIVRVVNHDADVYRVRVQRRDSVVQGALLDAAHLAAECSRRAADYTVLGRIGREVGGIVDDEQYVGRL